MDEKRVRIPLIMTVLAWAAFLGMVLFLNFGSVKPIWKETLPFAVPGLLLTVITILSAKDKIRPVSAEMLTAVISLISVPACFFLLIVTGFRISMNDITDPVYYQRMLRVGGYPDNVLVSQFPEAVPEGAEDVSMLYRAQVLQGAGVYLLSCVLPEEEGAALAARWEKEAAAVISVEEAAEHGIRLSDLPGSVRERLTAEAEVILLDREPDAGVPNHGKEKLILWDPCGIVVWYSTVW